MDIVPEFSFFIDCAKIGETARNFEIEAGEAERAALAKRFGLVAIDRLRAKAVVARASGDLVHLQCQLSADIVQSCNVTSRPLKKTVNTDFERTFSATAEECFGSDTEPPEEIPAGGPESTRQSPEPPDPMVNGGFDLGETVAEQLSLEIDPFPRSAGGGFDGYSSSGRDGDDALKTSPFAVLERLKKKL